MMTRPQAEALYSLMSRPEWQVYMAYKLDRLEQLHKELEWESENIKKIQGQIAEIRRDLELRQSVDDYLAMQHNG